MRVIMVGRGGNTHIFHSDTVQAGTFLLNFTSLSSTVYSIRVEIIAVEDVLKEKC